jgi:hypothetical protein
MWMITWAILNDLIKACPQSEALISTGPSESTALVGPLLSKETVQDKAHKPFEGLLYLLRCQKQDTEGRSKGARLSQRRLIVQRDRSCPSNQAHDLTSVTALVWASRGYFAS